jgi:hypothetical protein
MQIRRTRSQATARLDLDDCLRGTNVDTLTAAGARGQELDFWQRPWRSDVPLGNHPLFGASHSLIDPLAYRIAEQLAPGAVAKFAETEEGHDNGRLLQIEIGN